MAPAQPEALVRRLWAVAAIMAFVVACGSEPATSEWHEESGYRWRELRVRGEGAGFASVPAARAGIRFENTVSLESMLQNRHLAHGSGAALGDVDGDGLVDIYFARIDGPGALYRNQGGWRFENITTRAGVAADGQRSTGAVLADIDGDGDLDLFVTSLGGPNALYRNDGTGRFTEITVEAGLADSLGATTAAFADIDDDGDLDLYITTYKTRTTHDRFSARERAFDQVVKRVADSFYVAPQFAADYRVVDRPELNAVTLVQRADPDRLYINDGTGRFTRESLTGGRFLDAQGAPLASEPEYFGLAARFHDVNDDGHPDLYVCNDFEDPDEFWLNDGTGIFRAAPALALRATSNSCMSVEFSDVDRDGTVDIFAADMLALDDRRLKMQTPTHTPFPKRVGAIDDRPQMQRNTLQRNRGDGTFAQVAEMARVDASGWTWGSLFLDVDLDGWEDLLLSTGHRWDVMHADTWERLSTTFASIPWNRELAEFPPLPLPNVAFRNEGGLRFSDATAAWRFGDESDISHGLAAGDLDGDGDLDVVATRLDAPPLLYLNDAGAPRIAVRLAGRTPNTGAIGGVIFVRGGPVPEQRKEVTAGGLYLSSSDAMQVFAARDSGAHEIEVRWPGGGRTVVTDARPNRLYEIRQPDESAPTVAADSRLASETEAPLFEDVSHLLGHRHVDSLFEDANRQPLLPMRFSQLGPGVAWADVDRDGDEDLLIGTGRGGAATLFRNTGGRFTRERLGTGSAPHDLTTLLALPLSSGRMRIVAGQSSYEASSPRAALDLPGVIELSASGTPRVIFGGDTSSVGPLAAADYDGDGDLDLFVGGRIAPGAYPGSPRSRLLRNDNGSFTPDSANQAAFMAPGLVSAAVFSDIDHDGDADLLLAVEWGPIRILRNDGGRFTDITPSTSLARHTGRWNGVATGDLNGDGRLDIIATGWGTNTHMRASPDRPLLLYYGNFDPGWSLDLLPARADATGVVRPQESLSRLTAAMPSIRRRLRTFAAYSDATVEQTLGEAMASARRLEVTGLEHLVFFASDTGWVATALPVEAQAAPAFAALVGDADGDGREDLFLSQNFFATTIGTPRYDAGRGLWLLGDSSGGLIPMPGQRSGVRVYGEQRGAALADFDRDGRVDLVVTQNGAETRLYRNVGANPGLRVRLRGLAGNPDAIGAKLRLRGSRGLGPVREIQAGSGYWSQNGAVQVMALREPVLAVWVQWPGGNTTETPVPAGAREIVIAQP